MIFPANPLQLLSGNSLAFSPKTQYTYPMRIEGISNDGPLQSVKAEAVMRVVSMALSNQEQQGRNLMQMMNSAQVITDPALGNRINILA